MACVDNEIRRRDVGRQVYGYGTPKLPNAYVDRHELPMDKLKKQNSYEVATSHGNITLTSNKPNFGFMPTADAVFFLREECLGSRFDSYPARYYPTGSR